MPFSTEDQKGLETWNENAEKLQAIDVVLTCLRNSRKCRRHAGARVLELRAAAGSYSPHAQRIGRTASVRSEATPRTAERVLVEVTPHATDVRFRPAVITAGDLG